MMQQQRGPALGEVVDDLLEKHRAPDRYAMYHAAEFEAWRNWEKSGKDESSNGKSWRLVAEHIGDAYHAPTSLEPVA